AILDKTPDFLQTGCRRGPLQIKGRLKNDRNRIGNRTFRNRLSRQIAERPARRPLFPRDEPLGRPLRRNPPPDSEWNRRISAHSGWWRPSDGDGRSFAAGVRRGL